MHLAQVLNKSYKKGHKLDKLSLMKIYQLKYRSSDIGLNFRLSRSCTKDHKEGSSILIGIFP